MPDGASLQRDCNIVNLLRVALSPVTDDRARTQAVKSLSNFRDDERVEQFFTDRAEQERRALLRQRALNLKKRPIK